VWRRIEHGGVALAEFLDPELFWRWESGAQDEMIFFADSREAIPNLEEYRLPNNGSSRVFNGQEQEAISQAVSNDEMSLS